jgi:hypothetical protein
LAGAVGDVVLRDFVIGAVEQGKGLDESCLVDGNHLQRRWVDIFTSWLQNLCPRQDGNHQVQAVRLLPHGPAVLGLEILS